MPLYCLLSVPLDVITNESDCLECSYLRFFCADKTLLALVGSLTSSGCLGRSTSRSDRSGGTGGPCIGNDVKEFPPYPSAVMFPWLSC